MTFTGYDWYMLEYFIGMFYFGFFSGVVIYMVYRIAFRNLN